MAFCQREDADSAQLLASYLEQRFPDEPEPTKMHNIKIAGTVLGSRVLKHSQYWDSQMMTDEDIVSAHRTDTKASSRSRRK